jgi:hypothetical protein
MLSSILTILQVNLRSSICRVPSDSRPYHLDEQSGASEDLHILAPKFPQSHGKAENKENGYRDRVPAYQLCRPGIFILQDEIPLEVVLGSVERKLCCVHDLAKLLTSDP